MLAQPPRHGLPRWLGTPLPTWARWLLVTFAVAWLTMDLTYLFVGQLDPATMRFTLPVPLVIAEAVTKLALAIRPRLGALAAAATMVMSLAYSHYAAAVICAALVAATLVAGARLADLWAWLGVCGLWSVVLVVMEGPVDPLQASLTVSTLGVLLLVPIGSGLPVRRAMIRSRQARAQAEELATRQAGVREEERKRLSRELHDVVAHRIALASLMLGNQGVDPVTPEDSVADARRLLQIAGRELSALVETLRTPGNVISPTAPFEKNWSQGVEDIRSTLESSGFHLRVRHVGHLAQDIPPLAVETVVRCLREAATNVMRYGPPGCTCEVELDVTGTERLELTITSPLTAAIRTPASTGLGLIGLAERSDLLGGRCVFGPVGDDWVVSLVLPHAASGSELSIPTTLWFLDGSPAYAASDASGSPTDTDIAPDPSTS